MVFVDDEPILLDQREMDEDVKQRYFHRVRFKGGGSTTVNNTSTYTPSEYELELQKAQADYANAIAPNSLWLNDTARKILQDSIGAVQVDFNGLNNQAQQQLSNATSGMNTLAGSNTEANTAANNVLSGLSNQYTTAANNTNNQLTGYQFGNTAAANRTNADLGGISSQYGTIANSINQQLGDLANGYLPSQYQQNMQDSISSALKGTMGKTFNSLGQRGVLNSSVTNSAMNDIEKNAADSLAQQYQNNIGLVSGLLGQQIGNSNTALGQQANLSSQQLNNTLGVNSTNAGLTQQQLGNTNSAIGQQGELANTIRSNTLGTNNQNANIYNNIANLATQPIAAAGAAQEAAQTPATNLWNASLGLNNATTGALAAAAGKGTTNSSSTQTTSGGGGLLSGLLGGLF